MSVKKIKKEKEKRKEEESNTGGEEKKKKKNIKGNTVISHGHDMTPSKDYMSFFKKEIRIFSILGL